MNTTTRPPASAFTKCGKVRMSKDNKINLAMAVYLTLEALNESAPRGCDGLPMDLMTDHAGRGVSVQELLVKVLGFFGAPVPPPPASEIEHGHCGCGAPHHDSGDMVN